MYNNLNNQGRAIIVKFYPKINPTINGRSRLRTPNYFTTA